MDYFADTNEFKEKMAGYCSELLGGIAARRGQISTTKDPKEKQELIKQLYRWKNELNEFEKGLKKHTDLVKLPMESDAVLRRVDIIVLKYKDPHVEQRCLTMLNEHTDWPYKLTWYDSRNHSANFARLWNHLTRISTCDYVLIMDSDAFVEENWLSRMMSSFNEDFTCKATETSSTQMHPKKVGLVVPVTHKNGAHTVQGLHRRNFDKSPYLYDSQVSGFFFLFKKEMFDDIGCFNENFYLHGQDSEWIDRIIKSDWDIIVRGDVMVDHVVSASISAASERGEFDYQTDISYTKIIYDDIKRKKAENKYVVPR